MEAPEAIDNTEPVPPTQGRHSRRRALHIGCLGLLLFACGGLALVVAALQSGPVRIGIPGGTDLTFGSHSTVLSNYSFQNGTSYYFDLNGNGVRNIIELNYLQDSHSLELVLHHATKQDQNNRQLLTMKLP